MFEFLMTINYTQMAACVCDYYRLREQRLLGLQRRWITRKNTARVSINGKLTMHAMVRPQQTLNSANESKTTQIYHSTLEDHSSITKTYCTTLWRAELK